MKTCLCVLLFSVSAHAQTSVAPKAISMPVGQARLNAPAALGGINAGLMDGPGMLGAPVFDSLIGVQAAPGALTSASEVAASIEAAAVHIEAAALAPAGLQVSRAARDVGEALRAAGDVSKASSEQASGTGRRLEDIIMRRKGPSGPDAAVAVSERLGGLRRGLAASTRRLRSRGDRLASSGASRIEMGPSAGQGQAAQTLLTKVYTWMTAGLGLTAAVAYAMIATGAAAALAHAPLLFLGLAVVEVLLVIGLSAGIAKLPAGAAKAGFFLYAALNGATLAPLLLMYAGASIAGAFVVTAGMFGGMALFGHTTKRDLSSVGSFAMMALLGVILATVVNFFLHSTGLSMLLTYASVLIFVALTAFDAQRIRALSEKMKAEDSEGIAKVAVLGALTLYLDFINLFIQILKIMGKARSKN